MSDSEQRPEPVIGAAGRGKSPAMASLVAAARGRRKMVTPRGVIGMQHPDHLGIDVSSMPLWDMKIRLTRKEPRT